jgi:RND family efflux transporter MFP subunit
MVVTSASAYVCSWVISSVLLVGSGSPRPDVPIAAITVPSADVALSFVQPGRIAEIHFKEGDAVKAGDALVQLDDTADQVRLAQLRAESENLTNIQAAEASLAQKRVDLKKLEIAAERNAATELEVEHAKLDVTIAELSLKLAVFEHEQTKRKYDEAKIQVGNMTLKTPIDGSIEKIDVETGESVNALESVARIVKIDPLWIEVPVPVASTVNLKYGNPAKVQFPTPDNVSIDGTIVFIGAVADAASGTLRVRVELPNRANRPAGEHVRVSFPTSQDLMEQVEE